MTPTALIVDDEPLLRAELAEALAQAWPQLQILDQVGDGLAALAAVQRHRPGVVFLDVSMPRLDGLAAAERLRESGFGGEIVFVTAHAQHALRAFEHRAIDYLVKPLDQTRLEDTLARLRDRLAQGAEPVGQSAALIAELRQALQQAAPAPAVAPRRWLRASRGQQMHLIAISDVACLRAVPGYTQVMTRDGEHLVPESLKTLLAELDAQDFVQVHRNAVVNLRFVAAMRRERPGHYVVELKHGLGDVPATRSLADLLP